MGLVRRKPLSKRHSKNWMPCTEGRTPDRSRGSTDSKTGETTSLRRGHGWRAFESPKRRCDRSLDPSKTKSTLPARPWTHTNRWEFRAPFFRVTRPSATCWHRNSTQKDQSYIEHWHWRFWSSFFTHAPLIHSQSYNKTHRNW